MYGFVQNYERCSRQSYGGKMSSDSVSNLMKGHMESLAAEGKRVDGRNITEFRDVKSKQG